MWCVLLQELKGDKEIVMEAVKQDGRALAYGSEVWLWRGQEGRDKGESRAGVVRADGMMRGAMGGWVEGGGGSQGWGLSVSE